MTKRSCHSSLLVKCALPSVLSSSTEENLSSKNGEGTARKILSSWALLGSIPLHHLHREVYWKDEYRHLRKRRGGRVAKIVFPMSGTSFLLNTVDFGNSSSIIPCLAWPTFVSKFNHIAPCFAFFFCTHISNSFLMTSRQQPNKEYQPRRLYIHCLLSLTLWATLQDFELLKQVPESSHPTSSFGRNQHIGTLILS